MQLAKKTWRPWTFGGLKKSGTKTIITLGSEHHGMPPTSHTRLPVPSVEKGVSGPQAPKKIKPMHMVHARGLFRRHTSPSRLHTRDALQPMAPTANNTSVA